MVIASDSTGVDAHDARAAAATRAADVDAHVLAERSIHTLWLRQVYAGLVASLLGGAGGLYYVIHTWSTGPHRGWIALLSVLAIVLAIAVWLIRELLTVTSVRRMFFIGWNFTTYALIAAVSVLDGGLSSPFAMMWVLPIIYLLIGYTSRDVLVCGSIGIALYVATAAYAPGGASYAVFVLQMVVLVAALLMVLLGVRAREERERVLEGLRHQLLRLATSDSLTGLGNHQSFASAAAIELSRTVRYAHDIALLALDVDHFKAINDNHGHLAGDDVLRRLGDVFRTTVRDIDIVARVGGDEFLILCAETDLDRAVAVAERIRAAAGALDFGFQVTLSIGICSLRPHAPNLEELRACADRALYAAKRQGRDRYVLFSSQDFPEAASIGS